MDSSFQPEGVEVSSTKAQSKKGHAFFVGGILVGIASTLLVGGVIALGVFLASSLGGMNLASLDEDSAISAETIQKLQMLESTIQDYFYLSEVTDEQLEDGLYKGLLEALDDPYSEYYTAEELKTLQMSTSGIYSGIGAYVSLDSATGYPKISGVIDGTPASESDIRANDIIYQVDGESVSGKTLTQVVSQIRGEEGTDVELTLVREGASDYLHLTVTRARVETPTVSYRMLDDGQAYIQITEFDTVTTDQFADALATVRGQGMQGLIIDLRANPGGQLTTVVDIARMLLPEGLILYTEDKDGNREEYTCDGTHALDVPLVVLVDGNSASASEILAGAIQDYGIGTLVGTTTYGKGIVQRILSFNDGTAVKLTVEAYYTPSGRNIHGTGIDPDVECAFDSKAYYDTENPFDNQLEKAKEVLAELMN